jgi:mono/diheme cytochrome c family protein
MNERNDRMAFCVQLRKYHRRWRLVVALTLFFPVAAVAQGPKTPGVDFAHEVAPLIKSRCAECHTSGKYKGGVSFDTREALLKSKAVAPGKSAASTLVKRITSDDPEVRMPPKGKPLSAKEVDLLRAWIDQGLPWEPGYTFKVESYAAPLKPRRPELPPTRPGLEHPIDRLLAVYFTRHKQDPPAPVDDDAFLRRVYLDVIGLLPAPAETTAFLNDDQPDKRRRLVRRLLNEQRGFADHWLSFWNDLLRNDYQGTGYIDGGRKQISAWLYRSLAENKPYDRFVRELIAPTPESEGFIKGIQWRGNVNASQVRELQFAQNVAQVFFGANLKCASCHDSFIDHWKLNDAYGLAAVVADRPLEIHRCDKAQGAFAAPRFLWPELGTIDAKQPREKRLEQLAGLVTHPNNGRLTRTIANRLWQGLLGRGIVHPVDIMANRPWSEDVLDHLATFLTDNGYDVKKLLEHILTSRAYQSQPAVFEKEPAGDYVFRGPELRRLSAEEFVDAVWMLTSTAPAKAAAPVALPAFGDSVPPERRFIRASLVPADALMRSLGRPNREQVVTTRPDQLTTLQALDLSNGQVLANLLARGAANLLKTHAKATADELAEDVFFRSLCRRPTAEELATARDIIGSAPTADSVADLLWAILMLPEFQLIR